MARKMKDSGIEWIGEIPEGWETCLYKYCCSVQPGYPFDSAKFSNSSTDGFPLIRIRDITSGEIQTYYTDSYDSNYIITAGDLLVGMDGDFNVRWWNNSDALLNQRCCRIIEKKRVTRRFLYYVLPFTLQYINTLTYATTVKHLANSDILNFFISFPSLSVQKNITCYLDKNCSNIDTILSKTRSSIEEYKKLKQAVITQAVTKGVRGEREMKDSGVEWIGEIPKEFNPVQLKFFCKLITDGTHFSPTTVENGWPYITAGDVHGIGLDYNSAKRISEEDFQLLVAQGCQPLKGDVLLVKDGATTGRVGFVDSDTPCVILSSVAMLRPADNTDGHYLMYLLASDFLQKQILVSMAGSAMPRTTLTKLTKYIGLLPPLHEQKEIANYLDAKCAEIDGLIAKKEQLVKELESYKKSLIYEVVTGKREV